MFLIELSQNHMNTTFRFTVSAASDEVSSAESALSGCLGWVAELEETLSEFRDQSDVRKLKRAAVGERVPVSGHTLELLEESLRIADWSGQVFNPSFRSGNGLSLAENFEWDSQEGWAAKKRPEAAMGFGAIGKGYALDRVHRHLIQNGWSNHRLIAGGSSLVFSGQENTQVPWTVGFAFRKVGEQYQAVTYRCMGSPLFIGVSGNAEQGQHIVSPPIAKAVEPLMVAVTASSAARADGFSTAIYAHPSLVEKYVDGGFILIDNEERQYANQAFNKNFG